VKEGDMDGFLWSFIAGLFVGTFVGAGVISLCVIARRTDDAASALFKANNEFMRWESKERSR
jgi:hypothetical protein